jgi:hypothetical protein
MTGRSGLLKNDCEALESSSAKRNTNETPMRANRSSSRPAFHRPTVSRRRVPRVALSTPHPACSRFLTRRAAVFRAQRPVCRPRGCGELSVRLRGGVLRPAPSAERSCRPIKIGNKRKFWNLAHLECERELAVFYSPVFAIFSTSTSDFHSTFLPCATDRNKESARFGKTRLLAQDVGPGTERVMASRRHREWTTFGRANSHGGHKRGERQGENSIQTEEK